jgi:ABC-type multidrug transport system fused ATPase/permease subunit
VEKSVYKYILKHSLRQQITLTLLAVVSFPFLYAFYELPKQIVNGAIEGKKISFPVEVAGFQFDQVEYLLLLCAGFLGLVLINQGFKYIINTQRGLTGERMLRRLRYDLYTRVLRFPLPAFRKKSPGEIIAMITAEVEALGGFIGDAFALPVFQGGTLLVILGFLLYQNPFMALAAIALYPVQFYIIPKLQRKVNRMAKVRVRLMRGLSDRISESVSGVSEIHANGAERYELAEFSGRLGGIFDIRFQIYMWKFVIKFLNNTINQLGPFFFYSIGGYLVIKGELEVGTLVAAIAAHKDLAAPWKELLAYYEQRNDIQIKFEQVVEQFDVPDMASMETLVADTPLDKPLTGEVQAANLAFVDDGGNAVVEAANFRFAIGAHVALVGDAASGKDTLARLLARQYMWTSGTLKVGDANLAQAPSPLIGRRIGFVGENSYLFSATVRDNLFYGLKQKPVEPSKTEGDAAKALERRRKEALGAGNSTDDPEAGWIDYPALGVKDRAELETRALGDLAVVDLDTDIYRLGLRGRIDPRQRSDLAEKFLRARAALRERLAADTKIAALVEVFDETKYNANATLGENLLFGTPLGDTFDMDKLALHGYVQQVLEKAGLIGPLLEAGRRVAATMVELFADIPPGHPFFEQFSFIKAEDLPEFQAMLNRVNRDGIGAATPEDRTMLLSLPFRIVEARHRLGVVDDKMREGILRARRIFAENLPETLKGSVEFFDSARYNAASTIQDNILFGKIAYGQAQGAERVAALIGAVIEAEDLRSAVMDVGLDYQVGIGGSRLSAVQRQKLGLARALLKRPDILILAESLAVFDQAAQVRILANLRREFSGRSLVVTLDGAAAARGFDAIIEMRDGRIVREEKPEPAVKAAE